MNSFPCYGIWYSKTLDWVEFGYDKYTPSLERAVGRLTRMWPPAEIEELVLIETYGEGYTERVIACRQPNRESVIVISTKHEAVKMLLSQVPGVKVVDVEEDEPGFTLPKAA